ncbi:MAG: hypothetical protein U0746_08335 [Gemmataceae bacterium]
MTDDDYFDDAMVGVLDDDPADGGLTLTPEAFQAGFGEELHSTLDLATWRDQPDFAEELARIEAQVREAVGLETHFHERFRHEVFPLIAHSAAAPPGAGVYDADAALLNEVHDDLLVRGAVEACDGTNHVHDTLPLTVYQVGVSLVSYRGDRGTWQQRLFRRDLRQGGGDPAAEAMALLEARGKRGALNHAGPRDLLSELARRSLMAYAERAILLRKSEAIWRVGHGNPVPHELLTGAGCGELTVAALKVLRELIEGHKKFVFVASEPGDRLLLTLGQALRPLQYAIVGTLPDRIGHLADTVYFAPRATGDEWDGEPLTPVGWVRRFMRDVAPKVVYGFYRATPLAPGHLFFAHVDHADEAAHVALADSLMQEHRGFPMLITLADRVCQAVFGGGYLDRMTEAAYAAAGVPWRYQSERATRG